MSDVLCPEDSSSRRSIEEVTPKTKLKRLQDRCSRDQQGRHGVTTDGFEQPVGLFSRDNSRMSAPNTGPPDKRLADHSASSAPDQSPAPKRLKTKADNDLLSTNSKLSANPNNNNTINGSSPKPGGKIDNYFGRAGRAGKAAADNKVASSGKQSSGKEFSDLHKQLSKQTETIRALELDKQQWEEAQQTGAEDHVQELQQVRGQMQELQSELESQHRMNEQRDSKCKDVLEDLMVERALQQRTEVRERLRRDGVRLGHVTMKYQGVNKVQLWEDGQAFLDLANKKHEVDESRERAQAQLKRLKPRSAKDKQRKQAAAGAQEGVVQVFEHVTRLRLKNLDREEDKLKDDRVKLEEEKNLHIRELKRVRDEDESPYNDYRVLGKPERYLLTNLLGRGGFSEVYKAFDLKEYKEVVIKMHRLHSHWSEDRKAGYQKHASREYQIHCKLEHQNIVKLSDVFTVDTDCFATVMEYCPGKDLDQLLQINKLLPEKEAKLVMVQVLEGLRYLNTRQQKVIHYDLKPANILFTQDGMVKITDFGLSKIMDDDAGSDMELTSQGAGTYWYLPPECFKKDSPRICTKVDVFSAGVIFYQMLYGKRPFGEGMSQEQIFHEGTITKATSVDFPATPKVSAECKEVVRRCLAHRAGDRPDISRLVEDPYFSFPIRSR